MMTMIFSKPAMRSSANDQKETDFEGLFLAHYDRVYGLLYRLVGNRVEAEDLAQEVFLKFYQTPPQRGETNIGAWLYRVATNAGYNAVRGRRRQWELNRHLLPEHDDSADPLAQTIVNEETATVRQALAQLTPAQGQLLLLRQMGLSYAELGQACEIAPNSVGKLLERASQAFRAAYLTVAKERPHV